MWRVALDTPECVERNAAAWLSPEEKARAARFRIENKRREYIVSHGALRGVLSEYLAMAPAAIGIRKDQLGQPVLDGGISGEEITFSLSHTRGMALIGITRDRGIGVDVEERVAGRPFLDLSRRFFTAREALALGELSGEERETLFYQLWTRKEAVLKGMGGGLALGLDRVDVLYPPSDGLASWLIRSLDAGYRYAAAAAVEGGGMTWRFWDWSGAEA